MSTETVHLRIYDDRSRDVPQPLGPMAVEVPWRATDEQVVEAIKAEHVMLAYLDER